MLLNKAGTTLIAYPAAGGTVTLPTITAIGNSAFSDCTALESVSLLAATTIGNSAFDGCTALESVSLPMAETIGTYAFHGCTSLESVSIPMATTIGVRVFHNTGTTALTITLGSTVPTVGTDSFSYVTSPKNVTVKRPSSATGYGYSPTNTTTDNWGNAFRGKGWWTGTPYVTGTVNSNIVLIITDL
jgi:hypothetical protein